MATCNEQYFIDVDACDATYASDKSACLLKPTEQEQIECLQQALARRTACEQAAYLRWVQCLGVSSVQPPDGDCGCGGGAS